VTDSASQEAGTEWWMELTGQEGEGMVLKPLDFIHKGRRGLRQPAVKCRGREYVYIIDRNCDHGNRFAQGVENFEHDAGFRVRRMRNPVDEQSYVSLLEQVLIHIAAQRNALVQFRPHVLLT
jgi:PNKP adenylyltransferase domain, ligase domain